MAHTINYQHSGTREGNISYTVSIRGAVPDDIADRLSRVHAEAILSGVEPGGSSLTKLGTAS